MIADRKPLRYIPMYAPCGSGRKAVGVILSHEAFMRLDECAKKEDVPRGTLAGRLIEEALQDGLPSS